MKDLKRTDLMGVPTLVAFPSAIRILLTGRWRNPAEPSPSQINLSSEASQVPTSIVTLVSAAYATSPAFVQGYAASVASSEADTLQPPAPSWPYPGPITLGRLMHAIVQKGWQPSDEVNAFERWEFKLGRCGKACVEFASELLSIEESEIRDYLAGLAQGLGGRSSHWLSPNFPNKH